MHEDKEWLFFCCTKSSKDIPAMPIEESVKLPLRVQCDKLGWRLVTAKLPFFKTHQCRNCCAIVNCTFSMSHSYTADKNRSQAHKSNVSSDPLSYIDYGVSSCCKI